MNYAQRHRQYIDKYKEWYSLSQYIQKLSDWITDEEINDMYLLKNTEDIKRLRDKIEEQVRREFFAVTEEGFDAEDLNWIKSQGWILLS